MTYAGITRDRDKILQGAGKLGLVSLQFDQLRLFLIGSQNLICML